MSALPAPDAPIPPARAGAPTRGSHAFLAALALSLAFVTSGTARGTPEDAPAGKAAKPERLQAFELKMLDRTPTVKFQARPQYPFALRKAGVSGEVVVDFIVDPQGNVVNAYALRSTQREFEAAAVEAVSKWKFKPGEKGGRAVHTHMQVPIVFSLGKK